MNDFSELEKQRLDKRYQSIRRTINQAPNTYNSTVASASASLVQPTTTITANNIQLKHMKTNSSLNQSPPPPSTSVIKSKNEAAVTTSSSSEPPTNEQNLLSQPGLKFITRPDLHQILRQYPDAKELTKQSVTLASMLQKIRSNP